jgi:hypothetical protein
MTNEDVTTFHNDRARTGAEVGVARRGSHKEVRKYYGRWAKRYEVHPPGHPPTLPGDVASQPWYPSAVRGAPLFLSQWRIEERAKIPAALRQFVRVEELTEDLRLSISLKTLNPAMPLIVRGNIVTPGWLLDHPDVNRPGVPTPISELSY